MHERLIGQSALDLQQVQANQLKVKMQRGTLWLSMVSTRLQLGGTAYSERLNATFRQRLASLTRTTHALVRQPETLHLDMYAMGCVHNFCTYHDSLRQPFYLAHGGDVGYGASQPLRPA